VLSLLVLLQPKRKSDVEASEDDCIPGDHPNERQRPRARLRHQNDAEGDRQRAVEDEQPFMLQHAAQRDGAPDLSGPMTSKLADSSPSMSPIASRDLYFE
jgi:hypothetical protein